MLYIDSSNSIDDAGEVADFACKRGGPLGRERAVFPGSKHAGGCVNMHEDAGDYVTETAPPPPPAQSATDVSAVAVPCSGIIYSET